MPSAPEGTWVPFDSTCLEAGMWDGPSETLILRFRPSGRTYPYPGVPYDVWDALVNADSKGTFFNAHIKGYYE